MPSIVATGRRGATAVRADLGRRQDVSVQGSRAALYRYGPEDGPGILAVHGFRGTHAGLEPLAVELAAAGYRVSVPDLPGTGDSSPRAGRHDAAGYGSWIADLLRRLPPQRVVLGHSFGSVIAAHAVRRGARPPGVVLVNPILCPPLDGSRRCVIAAVRAYYALGRVLPEPAARRVLASRLIAWTSGALMTTAETGAQRSWIRAEHVRQADQFASRDTVLESYASSIVSGVPELAGELFMPTLLVGGDRDPLCPADAYGALAAELTRGSSYVFPGRGHLLPYEEAPELARVIAGWDHRVRPEHSERERGGRST